MHNLVKSIEYSDRQDSTALSEMINKAISNDAKSLMVLACDRNGFTAAQIDPILQAIDIPIFGGIFPTILHNQHHYDRGFLVCSLSQTVQIHHNNMAENLSLEVSAKLPALDATSNSIMIILDGLSQYIDSFINNLYDCTGSAINIFGGGAGSLSFEQKPCIISNNGLLENHAQIVVLPRLMNIGIEHGWEILAGPFMITEAEGNTIHSLNYSPAYNVYKEIVSSHSELSFETSDFFEIAKTFPFGMERLDGEVLVRDIIKVTQDGLLCVGNVPVNTMIYILNGHPQQLIDAAAHAVNVKPDEFTAQTDAFVFDCISRKLFLTDRFDDELHAIKSQLPSNANLIGVLSLGEIANSEGSVIQFHNKTTVIGISP